MSGKKDPEVTIDIGLGAKASLEAKVSTEIPAQSSGRLLDALTDIIRPFRAPRIEGRSNQAAARRSAGRSRAESTPAHGN
jgi:hypothetical protein